MQADGQFKISYFPSFEARETALEQAVGHLVPCRHNGPRRFWRDFKKITGHGLSAADREHIAYIAADPKDSLAFGSPLQVLAAARMAGAGLPGESSAGRDLAAEMKIEALLHQPIRTLSGGESVKLALAKSLALARTASQFVAVSPFSWLSQSNRGLFERVVDEYQRRRVPARVLALEGEDDPSPIDAGTLFQGASENPAFSMRLSDVRIAIGSPLNAVADDQLWARVADFDSRLVSPCLLEGGNGQGKSLLAKALAGAVTVRGRALVASEAVSGRARLLFQDVMTQTLLRSFNAILNTAPGGRRGPVSKLYQRLCRAVEENGGPACGSFKNRAQAPAADRRTLLEVKLALIAARLADTPPALILDEPDWGLSRAAAIALTAAVINAARERKVPVVLISHKPWWRPLAGSLLNVTKVKLSETGCPFEIRLQAG